MKLGPYVSAFPNGEKLSEPECDGVLLNDAADCLRKPFGEADKRDDVQGVEARSGEPFNVTNLSMLKLRELRV